MKLDTKLADALNAQVSAELAAAHNYLAVAAYFDANDLPGFAAWFRAQSQEETLHAMKFYDFIVRRDADVTLEAIGKPASGFTSPLAAIEAGLEMEQGVTAQIHALYALSLEVKDFASQSLLSWFLDEQVEEEDNFRNLLIKIKAAGNDPWNLQLLDTELAKRSAEPTAEA